MSEFPCRLRVPARVLFEGGIEAAFLPGADGSFEVLARHGPLVAVLGNGPSLLSVPGGARRFRLQGGVARVSEGSLEILCRDASEESDSGRSDDRILREALGDGGGPRR